MEANPRFSFPLSLAKVMTSTNLFAIAAGRVDLGAIDGVLYCITGR